MTTNRLAEDTERDGLPSLAQQGFSVRDRDLRPLGRRIAGKRVERDMTQRALAHKAGLSQHTIAMVEQGKQPSISLNAILSITEALEADIRWLCYGDERREGRSDA